MGRTLWTSRHRIVVISSALIVAISACGSREPATPDTSTPATTAPSTTIASAPSDTTLAMVTLTATGCDYDGPANVAVGQLRIGMSNETTGQFDIDLWLVQEGHDYDELAAHIDEERRRNEANEVSLGHPTFATVVAEASAASGSTRELVGDVGVGTYGMACIFFDQPGSLGGIWAVGPITVSE